MIVIDLGFMQPQRLWWMLLAPALLLLYAGLLVWRRSRTHGRPSSTLERVVPRQQGWKRHIAVLAAVLSLVALTVAYAQPKGQVQVPRDRATVVVTIDVSRSMIATDVAPNRLDAAKQAAKDFLGMLPDGFNVSLVSFAGTAAVLVPPTLDRGDVAAAIDELKVAPSTAIGDGIYAALAAMAQAPPDPDHPDDPPPGAIVLLSDGYTNIGRPSAQAAQEAKNEGIPIYTIAYGTPGGVVVDNGRREPVPVNPAELGTVSNISGGKAFQAGSADQLREVYQNIAQSVGYVWVDQEITEQFVGYALAFAILAALALMSLAARWP